MTEYHKVFKIASGITKLIMHCSSRCQ